MRLACQRSLFQLRFNQFRQKLHRHGALGQDGFVVTHEIKLVVKFALHLPAQTNVRHAANEIRAELHGALLGANVKISGNMQFVKQKPAEV